MDLLPQSHLEIFFLLGSGLLCAHKTLVSLLSCTNRASIATSCHVLNPYNMLLHLICISNFFIVARSGGSGAVANLLSIFFANSRIDAVNFALATIFHWDIFQRGTAVLDIELGRNFTHLMPRCRGRCLHLYFGILGWCI